MNLSIDTEVIFDERRGKDYISANPPFMIHQHFIKTNLVVVHFTIMHVVVIQTEQF